MIQAAPFTLKFMDISFTGETDWSPSVSLQKVQTVEGKEVQTEITVQLAENKQMTKFSLVPTEEFPKLDLSNTSAGKSSRETFYEKLKRWVSRLNLIPKEFIFYGEHEGERFSFSKPHPYYTKPVSLTLESIKGGIYLKEKELRLSHFFVHVRDGAQGGLNCLMDISSKLLPHYLIYELPFQVEGSGVPNSQIVAVYHDGSPCVWKERTIRYTHPYIPGILEFNHLEESKVYRGDSSTDSTTYKNALAACVFSKDWNEDSVVFIPREECEDLEDLDGRTATSMETDASALTETGAKSAIVSHASRSVKASDESSKRDESATLYHLLGEEEIVESPYVYSDGKCNYLTETRRQKCRLETEGEEKYVLFYTLPLSFKVLVNTNDMRLQGKSVLPQGLYSLKGGAWTELNKMYREKNEGKEYEAFPYPEDACSEAIREAQEATHPRMRAVYQRLGKMVGCYVYDENFRTYYDRIYKEGLLKTVTSILPEHEHLIVPLLHVVREDPNLDDPSLFQPKADFSKGREFAFSENISWGHGGNASTYRNLYNFLNADNGGRTVYVYVHFLDSLKLLPLLKAKNLNVVYGVGNGSSRIGPSQVLTQTNYKDIARLLDLNQLTSFGLTSQYDCEPDDVLTIQPFAESLARQKMLEEFTIPRYMGVANFEYLLLNGIDHNQSIRKLSFSGIYGDIYVFLIGKMLAKNKTLTRLYVGGDKLKDLECLNELGRGLAQNSTLQYFQFEVLTLISPEEMNNPWYKKPPLPGRGHFSSPLNLDPFKKSLVEYRGHLTLRREVIFRAKEVETLLDSIKRERDVLGYTTYR
ncbi:MAG TPA: hypothetical protein PLY23_01350 [Alphaproteobacteria bacterium]|nr:hypothetical protein [Alphaproteobacteria bacterium]HQS93306.1 hypothetical protein [Alphaproteobacteria bacterium]